MEAAALGGPVHSLLYLTFHHDRCTVRDTYFEVLLTIMIRDELQICSLNAESIKVGIVKRGSFCPGPSKAYSGGVSLGAVGSALLSPDLANPRVCGEEFERRHHSGAFVALLCQGGVAFALDLSFSHRPGKLSPPSSHSRS